MLYTLHVLLPHSHLPHNVPHSHNCKNSIASVPDVGEMNPSQIAESHIGQLSILLPEVS